MARPSICEPARDSRWIPGIYNYCDSWCERCRLSSRCLTFATLKASGEPQTHEEFRRHVERAFDDTLGMLQEKAGEPGIEVSETRDPGEAARERAAQDLVHDHPLMQAARRYAALSRTWLQAMLVRPGASPEGAQAHKAKAPDADLTREQAIEVIERYMYFIVAKLSRALSQMAEAAGVRNDDGQPDDTCLSDANGSAKVALHAIEMSLDAWFELMFYEKDAAALMQALLALTAVREGTDHAFPRAHAFVRPGFDTGEEPWPEDGSYSSVNSSS